MSIRSTASMLYFSTRAARTVAAGVSPTPLRPHINGCGIKGNCLCYCIIFQNIFSLTEQEEVIENQRKKAIISGKK